MAVDQTLTGRLRASLVHGLRWAPVSLLLIMATYGFLMEPEARTAALEDMRTWSWLDFASMYARPALFIALFHFVTVRAQTEKRGL